MTLVKPSGETCDDGDYDKRAMALMSWPSSGWTPAPPASQSTYLVSQAGASFDPGLPFGNYSVCIEDANRSTPRRHKTTYDNTSPDGRSSVLELPVSSNTNQWTASTTC
jgi:hypothetical protein